MSKKLIGIITMVILTSTLVLSACGSKTSNSDSKDSASTASTQKTTVSFWEATVTPERSSFFQDFITKCKEKYPNITIDYLGVPGDINAYYQKVDVAVASGSAPDVTMSFNSGYISRGIYEPLDTYFDKWSDKDKMSPAGIASNKALDAKEGKLYALPYSAQTWNIWIRPDWFKAANIAIPTTWDEFFTAANKLTDKAKDQYGLSIRGGSGSANTLEMLMYSYSGITDYFTADGKSTINDPLNVEFADKYLGLYNVSSPQDDLTKGWTELAATFQSGKAAMVIHNLGSASSMEKAFSGDRTKFEAIAFPKSTKGYIVHPGLMPLGISMSKTSKVKNEAWNVMTYFVSKDINSARGKLYGEIPANVDAAKDTWVNDLPYMKMASGLLSSKDVKFGTNPYYLPAYTTIQQKTAEPMIQKVMAKKMTSKEMLDQWAAALEKEKKDFDVANKK